MAAGALVCALAVGGCSGSGSDSSGTRADVASRGPAMDVPADARKRVLDAIDRMVSTSYRSTGRIDQKIHAEGASDEVERVVDDLAESTGPVKSTIEVESARRRAGVTDMQFGVSGGDMRLVQYDGQVFIERDGESRRLAGEVEDLLGPALKGDPWDLGDRWKVTAVDRVTVDRVAAERFSITVPAAEVRSMMEPVLAQFGLEPGVVDVDVGRAAVGVPSAGGQLVRGETATRVSAPIALLPGVWLLPEVPEGEIVIEADVEARYTDHGAAIRVEPSAPSGTISTFAELEEFVDGAP